MSASFIFSSSSAEINQNVIIDRVESLDVSCFHSAVLTTLVLTKMKLLLFQEGTVVCSLSDVSHRAEDDDCTWLVCPACASHQSLPSV